jgi:TRAP-type C4-dicarboxylate transport system permease small subunit
MSSFFHLTPMRARGPLRPLAWLIAVCDVAASCSLVGLVSLMVVIVSAQVVLRYLFNSSLDWADEIARLCFVWAIFIAIPLGLKGGAHIGIEMLVLRFPVWLRQLLARGVALLGAGLLLLMAWESLVIAWEQWDEMLSSVNASAAWFIVPLAFCGLHGGLHLIWQSLTGAVAVEELS